MQFHCTRIHQIRRERIIATRNELSWRKFYCFSINAQEKIIECQTPSTFAHRYSALQAYDSVCK